jgi:hypothetical protein
MEYVAQLGGGLASWIVIGDVKYAPIIPVEI